MKPDFSQASGSPAVHVVNANDALEPKATPTESLAEHVEARSQELANSLKSGAGTDRSKPHTKMIVSAAIVLLLGVIGAATFQIVKTNAAGSHASTRIAPPVVTVTTVKPKMQAVTDTIAVTGSVSAWDPLSVGAEVAGLRIKAVNVEEGDLVQKGQPICVLNSALLEAQLAQAKARLASSQASFKKAIQPNRAEEINALEAALKEAEANAVQEEAHVKQAKVNLENADLNARRFFNLAKMGATSKWDAETHQVTADTARQELLSSQAKLEATKSIAAQAREKYLEATRGGRTEDVQISKATIEETKAQIAQLQEQIAETVIRAPDKGLIAKRDAHIGDITSVGTPLFSIIRMNRLELRAQVSDLDLSKFKPGQIVSISTNEGDLGRIKGRVTLINPQVDPASRLGIVRIELPSDAGLKPGMFVRGEVKLGEREALTVPVESVVARNGESFVFSLDGNHAVSCPVKIGVQTERFVEITDGLAPNAAVIAKGARFLNDHDIVRVSQ